MIWIVLGLIIGLVIGKKVMEEGSKFLGFLLVLFFVILGFGVALLTGIKIVTQHSFQAFETFEKRNCSLVAFNDHFSLNGSFILGCGGVGEEANYVFYTKDEQGGIHLEKVNTNNAIIYEDRINDGLLIEKEIKTKQKLTLWYWAGEYEKKEYEFHVPPGTVVRNFKADLQ